MAFEDRSQDDDDAEALVRQLGDPTRPVATTQPVTNSLTTPISPPGWAGQSATSSSANAPRVSQNAQGGWQLNEHGNTRNLQGQEIADAQKYATDFWTANPTGFQASNPNSLGDAYQQFLGRAPDAAGLAAHQRNPLGFAGAIDTIANSAEAKARRAAPPAAAAGAAGSAAGGATTTPGAVSASTFRGFTPRHAMEGFDFNREQNTGKSAKDAFAYLANQAPPPPLEDKAALGAWFKQYIEPGMNQLGHKVTGVEGDKFGFENWQGKFDVDFGRGAGAPGGALAWQVDDGTAQQPANATYTPQANLAGALAAGANNNPSATDQLQAEIDAIINERGSPIDEEALLAQLQV